MTGEELSLPSKPVVLKRKLITHIHRYRYKEPRITKYRVNMIPTKETNKASRKW